jgi:hypothetical protein
MPRKLYPAFFLLALVLAGCSSLGLHPAQTFNDKLAYGYATHKAVIDTATNAVTTGALSVDDAEAVHQLGVESKTLLDAARLVYTAGDMDAANSKLLLATAVLTHLQRYLTARGVQ